MKKNIKYFYSAPEASVVELCSKDVIAVSHLSLQLLKEDIIEDAFAMD